MASIARSPDLGRKENPQCSHDGSPDRFNAGVTKTLFKGFGIDARYYRSDRNSLGYTYRDRLVVSARRTI